MTSRVIHQVRCRSPKDRQIFVDVAVVDALAIQVPGGDVVVFYMKASEATPYIKDVTGDGNGKGNRLNCSRVSHMERVKSTIDGTQKFDIEVLDSIALSIPPKQEPVTPGDTETDITNLHGVRNSGRYGSNVAIGLFMPGGEANRTIVDKTGLKLDHSAFHDGATRTGHINLVTEKGTTDNGTDGIAANHDSMPPTQLAFIASFIADSVSYVTPNSNTVSMIIPKSGQDEVDSTKFTVDPDTGEPCPPDNTDPNVYIGWPSDSQGSNVGVPANETTGKTGPIDMGILWYIKKVSPGFNPWFWFADINTPLAFSFFGSPGSLGSWGYRGFVLFNNYPVIWILSRNFPLSPMGQFGSPSLDLCAREGNWDSGVPPVPSPSMRGLPGGAFGPFGLLPMTHVQLGPPPDKNPYGIGVTGSNLWDGRPNVWQLTGLTQPPRIDLTKPWNPFSNPNKFPSAAAAKECALRFKSNWNAVANGHNDFIKAYVPGGGVSNGGPSYQQPPGWAWAIPWYDGFIGIGNPGFPPEGYSASFQNGIPPGVATHSLPLGVYIPATSWTLDVDQLNPGVWDTTRLEFTKNPLNYFFPIIDPPKLWHPPPPP